MKRLFARGVENLHHLALPQLDRTLCLYQMFPGAHTRDRSLLVCRVVSVCVYVCVEDEINVPAIALSAFRDNSS